MSSFECPSKAIGGHCPYETWRSATENVCPDLDLSAYDQMDCKTRATAAVVGGKLTVKHASPDCDKAAGLLGDGLDGKFAEYVRSEAHA